MQNQPVKEPTGIPFYSIRTGETHFCKLEPTIAAYINSSDMSVNASRGQDYGWRLDADWVKKVRAFKRDNTQVSILTAKNGGQKPTTVQILYHIYGEQLQRFFESQEEHENPFEEEYLEAIAKSGVDPKTVAEKPAVPAALADFRSAVDSEDEDDMADLIDEVVTEEDTTVKNENGKMTVPKGDGKTSTAKPKQK
jgi:hypothetical protein